ncbi:hypothetical protein EDEG_03311 [Edhazardia aedis USNM 41457]|uniref:Transmembrane protein n=1 Tax=Edhazardia aedis (strain USNM 41457) TaxID=1003232 RepID=J9D345_EDHAE|nr:hypothetical protein EDEG_03311 [Edhazardia aedis USNM 41457]|eukprot:EJW02251.1 hypothetical protein EDEG_03311 [Edhazardia aedis USNM 41457]
MLNQLCSLIHHYQLHLITSQHSNAKNTLFLIFLLSNYVFIDTFLAVYIVHTFKICDSVIDLSMRNFFLLQIILKNVVKMHLTNEILKILLKYDILSIYVLEPAINASSTIDFDVS